MSKPIKEPIIDKFSRKTEVGAYSPTDLAQIKALGKSIEDSNADLAKLKDTIHKYEPQINKLTSEVEALKRDNQDASTEEKDLKAKKILIEKTYAQIRVIENKIAEYVAQQISKKDLAEGIAITFNNLMERYQKIFHESYELRQIEEDYQNFRLLALNPLLEHQLYSSISAKPEFVLNKLFVFRSRISEFNTATLQFYSFYHQAMNDWAIFDLLHGNAKENVRTQYTNIKEEVDRIKERVEALHLSSKLRKIEAIHAVLVREDAYEMVSSPIQPLEDYVVFDVTIRHRDATKLSEYDDNREFKYVEYTTGGVRFDFSTGVVFNFGGNNDKYAIATEGSDRKVVTTDDNQFTPALAGMFHTSFRRSGIWSFGLTLGASLNVETFQLNSLFPGISALVGKKQKFIISVGPSFRQVDELRDHYKVGTGEGLSDSSDDTELTSKQFKVGLFFGVTYNLTQKQRAKFKIGSN